MSVEIGLKLDEIERAYMDMTPRSKELFEESRKITPAGVHHSGMITNWPIERGIYPPYMNKARGQYLWDVDGNKYTDYYNHGVLILGHAHPAIMKAIKEQLDRGGSMMGDFHELQLKHCRKVLKMIPSAEEVRFCCSGTEANMYAIRLARAYTKKKKIIKFAGNFHGSQDQLFIAVTPPFDKPNTGGVPEDCVKNTAVLYENDVEALEKTIKQGDVAAVICEFAHGSLGGGLIMDINFLKTIRETTEESGVVFIADEVITGFRLSPGGAQEFLGVIPDMTTLGKMVGGGMVGSGAFCGKREIMEFANPKAPGLERWEKAHSGGTFSGNPINMAAGYAALDTIDKAEGALNRHANKLGDKLKEELNEFFNEKNIMVQILGTGSMVSIQFTDKIIKAPQDLVDVDKEPAYKYHMWLLTQGINVYPKSNFYISAVHTEEDIDFLIEKTKEYLTKA